MVILAAATGIALNVAVKPLVGLIGGGVVLAGGVVVLVVVYVPKRQAAQQELELKDRLEVENQARSTLLQLVSSLLLIVTFIGTILQFDSTQRTAVKNLKVTQEGQITERITRAINQLGAKDSDGRPEMELRLGGIYSLERIARDSARDHWPTMEVFTAYLRENAGWTRPDDRIPSPEYIRASAPRPDIAAVLAVLSRRSHVGTETADQVVDLSGTDLRTATLVGATLRRAKFRESHLENAGLQLADLRRADFYRAVLYRADLGPSAPDRGPPSGIARPRTDLTCATFLLANLRLAVLTRAKLTGAYLADSYAEGALLDFADLRGAALERAHLQRASLHGADLRGADLRGARLDGTDLRGADLRGAKPLTPTQLRAATRDGTTLLGRGSGAPPRRRTCAEPTGTAAAPS